MSIERRVLLVEQLFYQLEQESALFQNKSGIICIAGCGKCCSYADIEASPLEFLPWAHNLYLLGQAELMLEKLNETNHSTCLLYQSVSHIESCTDYRYRGLICRLFSSAASSDKYGKLRFATCKGIKIGQADKYNQIVEAISNGLYVPVFTGYYMQLNQIDFYLGNKILPVNKALKMALEEVLQYYEYHPTLIV